MIQGQRLIYIGERSKRFGIVTIFVFISYEISSFSGTKEKTKNFDPKKQFCGSMTVWFASGSGDPCL
jgi:hypothetical protein